MPKSRTKNSRGPRRPSFRPSRHFEELTAIMRNEPTRFHRFSASVKYQLNIYLWMKEQRV
jgi:hypothetical protein